MSPSATLPAVPLRILSPEEAEERARNRKAWGELWRVITHEADAGPASEPNGNPDDETTAEEEESAA